MSLTPEPERQNRWWSGRLPQLTVLAIFAVLTITIAVSYERKQSNAVAARADEIEQPTSTTVAAQSSEPTRQASVPEAASPTAAAPPATATVGTQPAPNAVPQPTQSPETAGQASALETPSPTAAPPAAPSWTIVPPLAASATPTAPPISITDSSRFWETWARTDKPVADGSALRAWTWADERSAFTREMLEPYAGFAPDGMRQVIYFDHGRMEIVQQSGASAPWHVSAGLLVVELVEGRIQIGDDEFDESREPARIDIFLGPGTEGGLGLTYADIDAFGLRDEPAVPQGAAITQRMDLDGTHADDSSLLRHNVTSAIRVRTTGIDHSVASPFWEHMNLIDDVFVVDQQTGRGQIIRDNLFEVPFYATGYPITEAYWTRVSIDGEARDVLWQCFERRCLTYIPGRQPGFEILSGNVGQHYFQWRYGDTRR